MNKFKLFLENFLVYGMGGIISKIIPLVMVPITTRLMPDSTYYGISDLSNTIVSFGSAFAIMGMYDAMYRMFFEREEKQYKKVICSTTLNFVIVTSLTVFVFIIAFKEVIAEYFFGNRQYAYVVCISALTIFVDATNGIISAPTRMENRRKIFLITNTLSPILAYCVSIPMLLNGNYVLALPVAALTSGIVIEVTFAIMNRQWFKLDCYNKKILKQLLKIGIPLLPNLLIYWIFHSSDKLMITNLIGIGAAGIYSVGSKLGQASQLIYTAFAGGWQFFAFSTMKENNQVRQNSLIFEYLGIISFACTSLICAWSYSIYKFLFTAEYTEGYIVAPYLFFAPLLQMLFQVAANQFLVVKKTWPNMLILSTGAITNIVLNMLLIPILGIEGAAIATLFGYVVSDIVCVVVLIRMKLMLISKRFIYASVIIVAFLMIWRMLLSKNIIIATIMAMFYIIVLCFLYRSDLRQLIKIIKH